jgi:hypothetical protein
MGDAVVGHRAGVARRGGLMAGLACGTQTLSVITGQLRNWARSIGLTMRRARSRVVDREAWVAGLTSQVSREQMMGHGLLTNRPSVFEVGPLWAMWL